MIKTLYSFALVCTLLFSCISNNDKELPDVNKSGLPRLIPYSGDSLRKIVEEDNDSAFTNYVSVKMGLRGLSSGIKDFCVRVWLNQADGINVIDINTNNKMAEIIIIKSTGFHAFFGYYIKILQEKKTSKMNSDWGELIDTLYRYQIPYLKSGDIHEKGVDFLTEMSTIQFEIVKDGFYRYYEYKEPGFYRCLDSNSNNVHRFLSFLNKELQDSLYRPYPGTTGCASDSVFHDKDQ